MPLHHTFTPGRLLAKDKSPLRPVLSLNLGVQLFPTLHDRRPTPWMKTSEHARIREEPRTSVLSEEIRLLQVSGLLQLLNALQTDIRSTRSPFCFMSPVCPAACDGAAEASLLSRNGLSFLEGGVGVQLRLTVAGVGAGVGVRRLTGGGLQQSVCGGRGRGVSARVGAGMLPAQALDLLVQLVSLHLQRSPQLLQPLHFELQRLEVSVPQRLLRTQQDFGFYFC